MASISVAWSVNIATGSINLLLHTAIILTVLLHRELRQKKSNQLLINLSIAHALTGLSMSIKRELNVLIVPSYAYGHQALFMLAIDRCFMIRWPFRYNTMPKAFHIFLMGFSPVMAITVMVRALLNNDLPEAIKDVTSIKITMFAGIITSVLLLVPNFLVFMTLRKQKRAIRSLHGSIDYQAPSNEDTFSRRREIQAFYICFGCTISLISFWTPATLMKISEYYFGWKITDSEFRFALGVAGINPISDALIFAWFNAQVKNKVKQITSRMCTCFIRKE